jgi:putative flippase GtrA
MSDLTRFFKGVITSRSGAGWKTQFLQHLITGVAAMAGHYIVMWLVLSVYYFPVFASTCGFLVGATTRFFFSYFHIFEPERDVVNAVPHFILALALQMAINAGLLALFVSLGVPVWPAQLVTTIFLAGFNFLMYKFWVFK